MYFSLHQPNRDCTIMAMWIDAPVRKTEKYEDRTKLG